MKGLKCTATNCEHNHNCHCDAGVINVSEGGACKSKIAREFGTLGQAFENMRKGELEFASDFDYEKNEDVLIQCDSTKCSYNKDHTCGTDLVNIGNGFIKTKCFTKSVGK